MDRKQARNAVRNGLILLLLWVALTLVMCLAAVGIDALVAGPGA